MDIKKPYVPHTFGSPYGFNSYAAGNKQYGLGRSNPTMGPVDKTGYKERDRLQRARQNAIIKRLQDMQIGNYMSSGFLGGI
jgi:hypothetical protein